MRVLLSCSLFLFVTGIEANAQLDPGVVTQANSLVPIAGINRLVPVAGHRVRGDGDNEGYKVRADSLEHGPGLHDSLRPINDPDCPICFEAASDHHSLQPIPDPNMHLPAPTPVERPVLGPVSETCPPCQLERRLGIFDESGTGGRF